MAVASFLGLFLTQLSFLKAITMCTAVDVSILSLLSPIMAMVVALATGLDTMTPAKAIATAFVFLGVTIVNFSPSHHHK